MFKTTLAVALLTAAVMASGCASTQVSQETVSSPSGNYRFNLVSTRTGADLGGGKRLTSTLLIGDDGSVTIVGSEAGSMTVNAAMPTALAGLGAGVAAAIIADGNERKARVEADGRERAAAARRPDGGNVFNVQGGTGGNAQAENGDLDVRSYNDSYSGGSTSYSDGGNSYSDAYSSSDGNETRSYNDNYVRADVDTELDASQSSRTYFEDDVEVNIDIEEVDGDIELTAQDVDDVDVVVLND